jgi:AraC-like DNA-binding protein
MSASNNPPASQEVSVASPSPSPLHDHCSPEIKSIAHAQLCSDEHLYEALKPAATMKHCRSLVTDGQCLHQVGILEINQTVLLSHAGSEAEFHVEDNPNLHLVLCFQGVVPLQSDGGDGVIGPGGVMLVPSGSRHTITRNSSASVTLSPSQLATTIAAMAGIGGVPDSLGASLTTFPLITLDGARGRAPLQALVRYIDLCNAQLPGLPTRLVLDDTLHRHVAMLLKPDLLSEEPGDLQRIRERDGNSSFDGLIDYIRANIDQPLRMSDLEARSHYSRRALHYAFRQRMNCTPKQFIRRERLEWAMAQLREHGRRLTVRQVALACGYRYASHFTRDFQARFGLLPSEVRRRAP